MITVSVKENSVLVNAIWIVHELEDVLVLSGDLRTKRAKISGYMSDDENNNAVYLEPGEDSLHVGESDEDTEIHIQTPFKAKFISADIQRYTLCITLAKAEKSDVVYLWTAPRLEEKQ